MKIGLLAYHSACNFGATLQLLSTYMYLRNHGYYPIIINWVASDLERQYLKAPAEQLAMQTNLRQIVWKETVLCRTDEDVAVTIQQECIQAVIIGSDAVCQHHSLFERLIFPCKKIIAFQPATSDRLFPNPFWATWNKLLPRPIPVAVLSVSSQDSDYRYFLPSIRKEMSRQILSYVYSSVRDEWTKKMFAHITQGRYIPKVTPDPVFAFNTNAAELLPSRSEILERFSLPEKYILVSFVNWKTVDAQWLREFESMAGNDGITCVQLPFSSYESIGNMKRQIHLPLSPIDWFALIKYSQGYVGHNMHPIVVSLNTNVPFFSFDNYGLKHFNGLYTTDKSSKIKHILELGGLTDYRVSCLSRTFVPPAPEDVYQKVKNFDRSKSLRFAKQFYEQYGRMMQTITTLLEREAR